MNFSVPSGTTHPKLWYLAAAVLVLLALVFAALPLHSLFVTGPLRWQIHPPRFKQGGIEAVLFGAAVAAACLFAPSRSLRALLACVLGMLYLRLHYVDLPLLTGLAYVEAILAIGRLVVGGWRKAKEGDEDFMLHLLCGVGVYAVLIAFLSTAHLAYPVILFGLVLGLGLVSLAATRRAPYVYVAFKQGVSGSRVERLVFAALVTTVLVMAAKTHLIDDYDSWWYGLRSQYVLAQGGTLFADLGMSHFVFYYPKLYEALILPLCQFPDQSYPAAFNLICYALLLWIVRALVLRYVSDRSLAALVTLIVGWMPVGVFSALLVKPDLFAAMVMLIAASYLMRFVVKGGLGDGAIGAGALAVSLATKLTAIPFGGLLAIMSLPGLFLWLRRALGRSSSTTTEHFAYQHGLTFALGLTVFLIFTLRTYVLTGLPYVAPDFLVKTFKTLGFQEHFPYGGFSAIEIGGDWHFNLRSLGILYDAFFNPASLPHIVYSWTGNVFVLTGLLAAATFFAWRRERGFSRPFLLLGLPLLIFALFFVAFLGKQRGGAGYYYAFPLIFFTTVSAATLRFVPVGPRFWVVAALLLATAADGFAWFGATPQWRGGTAGFSINLTHSTFTTGEQTEFALESNGLAKIGISLQQAAAAGHCTALADGDESVLFNLPCGVESAHTLQVVGSPYLVDAGTMSHYVSQARFDFLVMPNVPPSTPLSKVFVAYARLPGVVRIDDQLFSALDLRGVAGPLPTLAAETPSGLPDTKSFPLTRYLSALKETHSDAPAEFWRQPLADADRDLKKYLGTDAWVLRTGTVAQVSSDVIPFPCPATLEFSLGLLPVDQITDVSDATLTVTWSELRSKRALGMAILPVDAHGFREVGVAIGKCGKQGTVITLQARRTAGASYASVVMGEPRMQP